MFTRKRTADLDTGPDAAAPETLFGRLRAALGRTRTGLVGRLAALLAGDAPIDANLVEEIEEILLSADVGVDATDRILADLDRRIGRRQVNDGAAVISALRDNMQAILAPVSEPLRIPDGGPRPFVILMVGVNGTGKTTTIGKLARRFRQQGHSVMLAAGDTFRAAAIEQIQAWGGRNGVPVIAQHIGADSASVVYDAMQAATARGIDILIADTAGRLHTQAGLMEELKKVRRVLGKIDPGAPHETLLVLDAGTGQNALVQAREFHAAVGVTGIVVTKLDGTAKGGMTFAIAESLGLPIRFVGVGEGADDLREFAAAEFVDALLGR